MTSQLDNKKTTLLKREASSAAMSIGIGLTHIRKFDFVQPGFFYSALSSFSFGLERILKLLVIWEYRVQNSGRFPTNKQLRDYGHNIHELMQFVKSGCEKRSLLMDDEVFQDEIFHLIVPYLSEYALTARYYNLDTLTDRGHSTLEPFHRWDAEVGALICKRHYRLNLEKRALIEQVSAKCEDAFSVMLQTESGSPITSLRDFYLHGMTVASKQRYSMYYLYVLVRLCSDFLAELDDELQEYPAISEFFVVFRNRDKQYILQKKSWNPNPPYYF
ncbi:hypothetical protein [Dechloromonas denitrificans]|uniref:hypothetical protein n=1 Tax=Dechloromonas denitrificans TaxID=281362 RepID=UPI001CFA307A|nr:hypothetical protein [Dechloromonas denitrificans]UCV08527.1 hypothetical protein KI615_03060 [Dechloromonas denitrificans]